ncbi:MAG TPA: acyltransferase [Caulobacteraceae bacterium]|jgi:peptidoglycan/LPS O-acetylase OafA/YrhL
MSNTLAAADRGPLLVRGGALDALRFAAAFFIVLYHYAENAPVSLFELHPAFSRGYLGTNFFLMLSGFVLAGAYGLRIGSGALGALQFLRRRIERVWPAHLAMLAAFIGLYFAASATGAPIRNPQWFDWSELPQQVFLVQSWGFFPGRSGWNIVTWTLSALILCYAMFPFAWRAFERLGAAWRGLLAALLLFAAADVFSHLVLGFPVYQMPLRWGVVRALPLFLLGVALARVAAELRMPRRAALAATLVSLAGLIGLQLWGEHNYLSLLLIGAVMTFATVWRGPYSRLVKDGAAISLSLFITNYFFGVVWFGAQRVLEAKLGLSTPVMWAIWALALPAALAFAWLFHHAVDQPSQRLIKRLHGRTAGRTAVPAPAPASA